MYGIDNRMTVDAHCVFRSVSVHLIPQMQADPQPQSSKHHVTIPRRMFSWDKYASASASQQARPRTANDPPVLESPHSIDLTLTESITPPPSPEVLSSHKHNASLTSLSISTSEPQPGPSWLLGATIDVAKVIAATGSCLPVPFIGPLFNAAVVLLETIERVQRNMQDLHELAEDVVSLMRLILAMAPAHALESGFERECRAVHGYLEELLRLIAQRVGKRGAAGWLIRYAKAHNISDAIQTYQRRISNIRADITLAAAMDVRSHVAGVDHVVCDVQSAVSDVKLEVSALRSQLAALAPAAGCLGISPAYSNETISPVAYSDDFKTILRGDIVLTDSIDTVVFGLRSQSSRSCGSGRPAGEGEVVVTRADYRASVQGDVRVVRLYSGPRAQQTWNRDFKMFESLQHHCLLQLHAISPSQRRPGLVFHGSAS
ncbi:hypothetical protein B0H11DRAFT_1194322 [Mycena galericulata]|nr:hypothetical protein B0H11DRAFT_1194322 [Mycena galericulata]